MNKSVFNRFSSLLLFLMLGVAAWGAQNIGNRNQGSAKVLDGKIFVLTCYVSETGWIDSQVEEYNSLLLEAEEWLVKQAKADGKEVSFVNATAGLDKPLLFDEIVSGNGVGDEPVDLVSKVMKKMGYNNGIEYIEWLNDTIDCDEGLVLIVANKPGRGYSMAYKDTYDPWMYYLEGTMLYTSYEEGVPDCAAGIAHEMCHLFGAEDLYATFVQTAENEARARELFPDDIMLRVSYDINELKIDKLTAWLIGLTDEMEDWYLSFLYE